MEAWHWAQAVLPTKVFESEGLDLLDEFPVCAELDAARKKVSTTASVIQLGLDCGNAWCAEERIVKRIFQSYSKSGFSQQRLTGIKTSNILNRTNEIHPACLSDYVMK